MTKTEVILSRRKSSPPIAMAPVAQERFEQLTQGACETLTLGDPTLMSTDVGPVIDEAVKAALDALAADMQTVGRPLLSVPNGAVVGAQPFGGQNPSDTGPKAGGPHYLRRFGTERTPSVNTTAAGGNASLISLENED